MFYAHDRHVLFIFWKRHATTRGDAASVPKRFLFLRRRKECAHLFGTLHEDFFGILQARAVVLVLLHRNAAERVMHIVIFAKQEVRIVVCNEWQPTLFRKRDEMRMDLFLLRDMPL